MVGRLCPVHCSTGHIPLSPGQPALSCALQHRQFPAFSLVSRLCPVRCSTGPFPLLYPYLYL